MAHQRNDGADSITVQCTLCSGIGASFCKECDSKLCGGCETEHRNDPPTRGHRLYGLCPTHGSGLLFYCISPECRVRICNACKASSHKTGHDVINVRLHFDEIRAKIMNLCTEFVAAGHLAQTGVLKRGLGELLDFLQIKSEEAERQATVDLDNTIEQKKSEITKKQAEVYRLSANMSCLPDEIPFLPLRKDVIESDIGYIEVEVEKLEETKQGIIMDVREKIEELSERIDLLHFLCQKQNNKVMEGLKVDSEQLVFNAENIKQLKEMYEELDEIFREADSGYIETAMKNVRQEVAGLGLGDPDAVDCLTGMGDEEAQAHETETASSPDSSIYEDLVYYEEAGGYTRQVGKSMFYVGLGKDDFDDEQDGGWRSQPSGRERTHTVDGHQRKHLSVGSRQVQPVGNDRQRTQSCDEIMQPRGNEGRPRNRSQTLPPLTAKGTSSHRKQTTSKGHQLLKARQGRASNDEAAASNDDLRAADRSAQYLECARRISSSERWRSWHVSCHEELVSKLEDMLTKDNLKSMVKKVTKFALTSSGKTITLKRCKTFKMFCEELERYGKISIGDYEYLREEFSRLRRVDCIRLIDECENAVREAKGVSHLLTLIKKH